MGLDADPANHGKKSTVLLLGRYGHTRPKDMSELRKRLLVGARIGRRSAR